MQRRFSLLLLLGLLIASPARAQETPTTLPDARVRISLEPQSEAIEGSAYPQIMRGEVMEASSDSVVVRIHPAVSPVRLAWDGVQRIDVSQGIPGRLESALRSAVGDAVLFGLGFVLINGLDDDSAYGHWAHAALAGAGLGMAAGGIRGAFWPQERWSRIGVP